jgi:hypothetical protein
LTLGGVKRIASGTQVLTSRTIGCDFVVDDICNTYIGD